MNGWLKRGFFLGMVVGVAGVVMSACADNESSIFIRGVLVPEGNDCGYTADPGSAQRLLGVMDLAFTREYWAGLLIGNQVVERGSSDLLRTESSRFVAEGAEVEIETTGGDLIQSFTVPVTGFADPGSQSEPGWGVALAVLIDSGTGNGLAGTFVEGQRSDVVGRVVAVVKVFGKTLGGQEIESGEFRYPISVCYGCSVSFPPEAADPGQGLPNCLATSEGGSTVDVPCLIGQDEALDCRVCHAMGAPNGLCEPM